MFPDQCFGIAGELNAQNGKLSSYSFVKATSERNANRRQQSQWSHLKLVSIAEAVLMTHFHQRSLLGVISKETQCGSSRPWPAARAHPRVIASTHLNRRLSFTEEESGCAVYVTASEGSAEHVRQLVRYSEYKKILRIPKNFL